MARLARYDPRGEVIRRRPFRAPRLMLAQVFLQGRQHVVGAVGVVLWLRGVRGFIRVCPAQRDQAQPEVADPGQQPVRRGPISPQDQDDGLRAVAFGVQATEPVRPPAVENAPDADLVAGGPRLAGYACSSSLRTAIASLGWCVCRLPGTLRTPVR